ncbi:uncharacterized protein LOC106755899 [Vigna radiata var. radiata]|uniref:Uncharacterized protein LOC106755899 n=1 Tax=Vigna radiata var. radiata TaxID=3916 RepID=A0A1S3TIN9_VIGRR|nr:uncharacterized protein LOC106755899 [Vigna radiata var. radiata]
MVVTSRSIEDHAKDLEEVFAQVRKFNMSLNPSKCTFGVQAGKFLGFMLIARGIEANPDKCRVVLEMRSPQSLKEVQRLVGRLTALSRFIPRLVLRIKPVVKMMKKDAQMCWDGQCEAAFKEVKKILTEPPVMERLKPNKELQLFLAVSDEVISVALVQEKPEMRLIYFLSRGLKEAEVRYQQVEKVALSPSRTSGCVGWSIELSEFGLRYEPRGSVKGKHLAEFAVELFPDTNESLCWKLSVDGSSGRQGRGVGVVLKGPGRLMVEQSLIFKFKVSNNQAEYEALLPGLKLARDLGAERVECRTNSQLVEGHMKGTFQIKDDQLLQYAHKAKQLEACFESVEIRHDLERRTPERTCCPCWPVQKKRATCLHSGAKTDWTGEIIQLIREQDEGGSLRVEDTKKIARYCLVGGDLYRRGYTMPLLKCLEGEEVDYVVRELHEETWECLPCSTL